MDRAAQLILWVGPPKRAKVTCKWKLMPWYRECEDYLASKLVPFPNLGLNSGRLLEPKTDHEVGVLGRQQPKKSNCGLFQGKRGFYNAALFTLLMILLG